MSQQMGRPKSETPKDTVIRCRVTKDFNEKLEKYCRENHVTKTDVIIEGVSRIIKK